MMIRPTAYLAALAVAVLVAACGTENVGNCADLWTDDTLPEPTFTPGGLWSVTYTVSGTAAVVSVQYRDEGGVVRIVSAPSLPWTYEMTGLPAGTRVSLEASAFAPPGLITVDVTATTGSSGSAESKAWSDSCGQVPQ
jgi:hypothetical protein